jgi:hypothetical protein
MLLSLTISYISFSLSYHYHYYAHVSLCLRYLLLPHTHVIPYFVNACLLMWLVDNARVRTVFVALASSLSLLYWCEVQHCRNDMKVKDRHAISLLLGIAILATLQWTVIGLNPLFYDGYVRIMCMPLPLLTKKRQYICIYICNQLLLYSQHL